MNDLLFFKVLFWFLLICALFISIHSMATPTPEDEEEQLKARPNVNPLYPRADRGFSQGEIHSLGTKFAMRLRLAGLVGFILTIFVFVNNCWPGWLGLTINELHRLAFSDVVLIIILWMQRFVEKGTWPFRMKR
jgi:hypothetical protein